MISRKVLSRVCGTPGGQLMLHLDHVENHWFSLIIFRRELSQIPPTVCVIIGKMALKQNFM